MADRIPGLLAMLDRGQDSALLRFSLGNEYLAREQHDRAAQHFEKAVELDSDYSAAWKLLGRSYEKAGREDDAMRAWRTGVEVAGRKGDRQAAKEMTVFLKRLERKRGGTP